MDSEDFSELISLSSENNIYIEIPEYIDIKNIPAFFDSLNAEKIAIVHNTESPERWQKLADNIIVNEHINIENESQFSFANLQIHRAGLTKEILDFNSLETFWQELLGGAYGEILRAKGIFNIMDGQCIYADYLQNAISQNFRPLNLPLSLDGRPTHFSGLEIIGSNLEKEAIAKTIGYFCLPDDIVNFYQEQVKQSLSASY